MKIFPVIVLLFGLCASITFAGVQGNMNFTKVYPNSKGSVTFHHDQHAERFADDCGYCHSALETFGGKVNELYAHKVCKLCHETHNGPSQCNQCHTEK